MNEADDRLAGDPVWELFPQAVHGLASRGLRSLSFGTCVSVAGLIAAGWFWSPLLAVMAISLAVAYRDFRTGWQLSRSMGARAGGKVCARFACAWGMWKIGTTSFFVCLAVILYCVFTNSVEQPEACFASLLLSVAAFTASAALTGWGVLAAYRSEMRIWLGEGVNRARVLCLAMLIVGFFFGVLVPACIGLAALDPRDWDAGYSGILSALVLSCPLAGSLVILRMLDAIHRRVIADRPGKFGPKVPTVGKWSA